MTCDPLHSIVLYYLWSGRISGEGGCGALALEDHEEMEAWKLPLQKDLVDRSQSNLGKRGIGVYLLEGHWREVR